MRKSNEAPVDWAGCSSFYDKTIDPKQSRFYVLVACFLSSQTKDEVTERAMTKLKQFGLTPDKMSQTDVQVIQELIHPVGFSKLKANDIPSSFDEIIKLPGIGPKMTNLIVQHAWGRTEGIAVDVHVHRISQRLGWVIPKKKDDPEDTRKQLQEWLPLDRWSTVNGLLVGFGQTICQSNPKCNQCLINHMCPVGIKNLNDENKSVKKKEEKKKKSNKKERI
eukprot:gene7782-9581_t